MILFLGFDGVLHPEPPSEAAKLFCHLPRLESLLRDSPDVVIVISSSWREASTLAELRALFSPDIGRRIIGMTPRWHECAELFQQIGFQRQSEVEGWLRQARLPWAKWVAVDDKPWLFKPALPNLVCCNPGVGLDAAAIELLKAKLQSASSYTTKP